MRRSTMSKKRPSRRTRKAPDLDPVSIRLEFLAGLMALPPDADEQDRIAIADRQRPREGLRQWRVDDQRAARSGDIHRPHAAGSIQQHRAGTWLDAVAVAYEMGRIGGVPRDERAGGH